MALTLTYSLADQDFEKTKSVGILNFSSQLLEHLAGRPELNQLTVLTNRTLMERVKIPAGVRIVPCDEANAGRLRRMVWDQWGVYRAAKNTGNEWLFLPKGFSSFLFRSPVKLALHVHDAIQDFYQQFYPGGLPRLERWYFQLCFRANLSQARVIFVSSDFIRSEVERVAARHHMPVPPIHVIGIGFAPPTAHLCDKQDRIMVLASGVPHKRTDLAIDYLARWQSQNGFAGTVEWVGRWPERVAKPMMTGWRYHQRLAEPEYRQLLNQVRLLVIFTEYEGFGMPPVEAVMAGTCPVYSDIPATREVMTGQGCAFRNESYDSFAHAMNSAMRVTPSQLEAWASSLYERFNWESVSNRFIEYLLEMQKVESRK